MMVAEKDFYLAKSDVENQIEFEPDDESLVKKSSKAHLILNPALNMDNPGFYREDSLATLPGPQKKEVSDSDLYEADSRYGWACCKPDFIQFMNRPRLFLVWLCLFGICQGLVVTGISFTVVTSLEKHFGYKSAQVALFGTAYDITYGICCIFVGYAGHNYKARWLGAGALVMAIGSLVMVVPKFIYGTYTAGEGIEEICRVGVPYEPLCETSTDWYYMFLFLLGEVILGIGATSLYVLGPSYLDEITKRGQGSLYLGIFYASAAVGPAIGFILGNPILDTWVDLKQVRKILFSLHLSIFGQSLG